MKTGAQQPDDEKAFRIAYLIAGYLRQTLTEAEHDELDAWIEASDENMQLFEDLTDEKNIEANLRWMEGVQTEKALAQTAAQLQFTDAGQLPRKQGVLWPYIAAASLVVAAITGLMLYRNQDEVPSKDTAAQGYTPPAGKVAAKLVVAGGREIDLGAASSGVLEQEEGFTVAKTSDSVVRYTGNSRTNAVPPYHVLSTTRGGQYSVVLSDGSRVWLNAASQLRYPALFAGASRTVELEGEGYFEVATNARQPFVVKLAKGAEVTVVGTRFNARAYGEDAGAVVSLEEGRVRLRQGADSLQLQPGDQVKAGTQGLQKVTHPGMAAATAWRRGQFVFRDAEIGTILEELARWYDVAVVYRTRNKEHFNLTVRRTDSLTHILRLLELTHTIHFTIENKTVYVLP